MVHTSRF